MLFVENVGKQGNYITAESRNAELAYQWEKIIVSYKSLTLFWPLILIFIISQGMSY